MVIEVTLAGWVLGHGWLALLVMTAAVTATDTLWGLLRRGVLADLAGLEVAATLARAAGDRRRPGDDRAGRVRLRGLADPAGAAAAAQAARRAQPALMAAAGSGRLK